MSRANRLTSWATAATLITALFLVIGCGGRPSVTPAAASSETTGPPPATPTASAVASSAPTPYQDIEPGTGLAAGTYVLHYASIGGAEQFPTLAITFTVPDGWDRVRVDGVVWGGDTRLGFVVADNLYVDPCDPGQGLRNPPVGQSVDDLSRALTTVAGWQAGEVSEDSFAGFGGQHVVMTAPADISSCREESSLLLHTLGSPGYVPAISNDEQHELWILNVQGTRLVIDAVSMPDASPGARQGLQSVVESIHIEP